ncbi:MAG: YCF48-related protein [Sterolibacterium sp.]
MKLCRTLCLFCAVTATALAAAEALVNAPVNAPPVWRAAPPIAAAEKAPVIAATRAGNRIVAVGDYGIVILSDDGKRFRQALKVPTRAVLTSVFFLDDRHGWAAGHDGTVLASSDGGESWQLLREEPAKDRVLLSIRFENLLRGFAVGQFGLMLATEDGGKTWHERRLVDGDMGDKHLMHIFAGGGRYFVAAEAGTLFHSEDGGRRWKAVQTSNKGSFWTGLVLADGGILAAGMRGHIYRSDDHGMTWKEVPSGTQQSITAIAQRSDGTLRLIGNAGTDLFSNDQGRSFAARNREDKFNHANLTALAAGPQGDVLFTLGGVVAEDR